MPRRGEYQRDFPQIELPARQARVGVRVVDAPNRCGELEAVRADPAWFRCRGLATELIDEWVDYCTAAQLSSARAAGYRRAIRLFCEFVDDHLGEGGTTASLANEEPDLAVALCEWERRLPAGFPAGSTLPASLASDLRGLIVYRAQHDQRPVAPRLEHVVAGATGVSWGGCRELDEFTRRDKRALVRAAWSWTTDLQRRLNAGWQQAAEGGHPADRGWTDVSNLLWGLAHQQVRPVDIRRGLPLFDRWPQELRSCLDQSAPGFHPRAATTKLLVWLVRQLYPHELDLHAFRVLLVAATGGCAPEEATGLAEDDVEFLPNGVRLTLTKRRAGKVSPRRFLDRNTAAASATAAREAEEFTGDARGEVREVVQRLLAATERVRLQAGDRDRRIFVAASVTPAGELRFARWSGGGADCGMRAWLAAAGVEITGPADIRRLRKSGKVEKAIAFGGRIADAADDHHEETFRGHYAQGTTLRVLSAEVITTAQDHWFDRAVDGPTVIHNLELLDEPDRLAGLGLTAEQAEQLRQGALDMGVAQCRDPFDSPYSRPGDLCAVAPLRCLECRNAWVLPSNLPQLLLFSDHLDLLRLRLRPEHFAALWGQSHANLTRVLVDRTDEEKTLARKQIHAGHATLHLPLSARAEFDR